MNIPKVFKGGGVTKAHLEEVQEDARRITLKRIREQEEEREYKAQRAAEKAKQREEASKPKKKTEK